MIRYLIVGSGYRAEFFGRTARTFPEIFEALFLCRSTEKAEWISRKTGIPATASVDDAVTFHPDYAVIVVNRPAIAETAEEWIQRGFPVLLETPAGADLEELRRLWKLYCEGARISVCEQYHRYPVVAAGLRRVKEGLIGEPTSLSLSLAHDYHGFSLIRTMLGVSGEPYVLRGETFQSPIIETDSRLSAIYDQETEVLKDRTMCHITFSSGKRAFYDFSSAQYHSYLRARNLSLKGTRGEWKDTVMRFLDEHGEPRQLPLLPEIPEKYRCLDTAGLRDIRKTWSVELGMENVQDEFAIATMLLDMKEYIDGGESPYRLEDALDDAYFWLLQNEMAEKPWEAISSAKMPWHS